MIERVNIPFIILIVLKDEVSPMSTSVDRDSFNSVISVQCVSPANHGEVPGTSTVTPAGCMHLSCVMRLILLIMKA